MSRHVLLLDLKDDPALIAAYEEHHAPGGVPAPVTRSIRDAGIRAMDIFRSGNRLVMLVDADDSFDADAKAAADRANPDVRAWEARMDAFQQALSWAREGEKWVPASRIFSLEQQG
jgi:L-rhamnose mutarotase